jgi:hypothetical protein
MADALIYLILFTVLNGSMFMIMKSFFSLPNAFLVSSAITVMTVWGVYGVAKYTEGLNFLTQFNDWEVTDSRFDITTNADERKTFYNVPKFSLNRGRAEGTVRLYM